MHSSGKESVVNFSLLTHSIFALPSILITISMAWFLLWSLTNFPFISLLTWQCSVKGSRSKLSWKLKLGIYSLPWGTVGALNPGIVRSLTASSEGNSSFHLAVWGISVSPSSTSSSASSGFLLLRTSLALNSPVSFASWLLYCQWCLDSLIIS